MLSKTALHLPLLLLSTFLLTSTTNANTQKPINTHNATEHLPHALALMSQHPLIDTHIDLPQIIRSLHRNPISALPLLNDTFPGHIDIPRMRTGHLGAAFWTVWAPCYDVSDEDPGPDFNTPTSHLRDALEMVDLIQNMIATHSDDFAFARSSAEIWRAFEQGKIAGLMGMEGTHMLGNSLSAMRLFAQLGVKYVTLTHTCHTAFASSSGATSSGSAGAAGERIGAVHEGNGLSALGRELIYELNRLGVMIDLSHTTDETMREAIALSEAPIVWTHAGTRQLQNHLRNLPDDILALIGDGPGQKDGVVQSVFFPGFIGPDADVAMVADHIEYLATKIGRQRVGIASDFDGMFETVRGLEDASKYPYLVAELLSRDWTDDEIKGVLGGNLMRIMDKVDEVADRMKHQPVSPAIWEKRQDLPSTKWGGGGVQVYWPSDVKEAVENMQVRHDEL